MEAGEIDGQACPRGENRGGRNHEYVQLVYPLFEELTDTATTLALAQCQGSPRAQRVGETIVKTHAEPSE